MPTQLAIDTLAANSPYSLENFQWLMENSAVNSYLSAESIEEIGKALNDRDDTFLKTQYPFMLEQFVKERDININFSLQQESLMNDFSRNVSEINHKVKANQQARNDDAEAEEKAGADDILKELN